MLFICKRFTRKISECYEFNLNYNFVKVLSCKNGFLLVEDVEREDGGTLLKHPQKSMAGNRARSLEQVFGKCAANQTAPSETISFSQGVQTRRSSFPLLSPCTNPRKGLSSSHENKFPSRILFLGCLKSHRFAAAGPTHYSMASIWQGKNCPILLSFFLLSCCP